MTGPLRGFPPLPGWEGHLTDACRENRQDFRHGLGARSCPREASRQGWGWTGDSEGQLLPWDFSPWERAPGGKGKEMSLSLVSGFVSHPGPAPSFAEGSLVRMHFVIFGCCPGPARGNPPRCLFLEGRRKAQNKLNTPVHVPMDVGSSGEHNVHPTLSDHPPGHDLNICTSA